MQSRFLMLTALLLFAGLVYAQSDTTQVSVKIISNDKKDSIIVDAQGQKWSKMTRTHNIQTRWFGGIDFGFANFADHTAYGSAASNAYAPGSNADWFDLKNGKSVNVNIWIVSQKVNLVQHTVNLKYALGLELNNYRFKNPVRYAENAPYVSWDNTEGRTYSKNKLAADYVTFPLMLNFDFGKKTSKSFKYTSKGGFKLNATQLREWGFSAGISAGYLYSARNKTITSDEGKEKLKDNFNLRPWKIAYVAELNLGYLSLYGSYALKSMYKNGLNMTPYTVGIRL